MLVKKKRKKNEEASIQRSIIDYSNFMKHPRYPHIKIGEYLFHIPNGGSRNAIEAVNLKRQGVKAGVPDLFLAIPIYPFGGMWFEVKSAKGKLSDNQKEWLFKLSVPIGNGEMTYSYQEVRSLDEFIKSVNDYLIKKDDR